MRGYSVQTGFKNRNLQLNLGCTGELGTDHNQRVYTLECQKCGFKYGANGSDIYQRRCPKCDGGAPGIGEIS